MMMPSSSSSSSPYSSSSSSAVVRVEKATSEFLIGPDWTMNIDICDIININPGVAKDVVKALKKRLQHKNPKVQLLALTLLETMVKNCGDYVHFQIAERNILPEMIKIVKKKTDMNVRDKILVLLDTWQEAFGGPGGKHSQYYWAYEELRRSGVVFPRRSSEAVPIFTPPPVHSTPRHVQAGYGMPINSSTRLDEAMAAEMETLSLSSMNSMRDVLELLADMLQAVNPSDRAAVKDEVIVDLVDQCRANQKKLMQMLTTTSDEELLGQGLELNDILQIVLAKHDAIASGSPLPLQLTNFSHPSTESSSKPTEVTESIPEQIIKPSAPVLALKTSQAEEEKKDDEEEEDDFAQLARRHSKTQSATQSTSNGNALALALPEPPAPIRTATKEQDYIDLLSITLSTPTPTAAATTTSTAASPHTPQTPAETMNQQPPAAYPYTATQTYPSYVVPWAQPQPQPQPQPPQYAPAAYPPPPWAATPGYFNNPSPIPAATYSYSSPRASMTNGNSWVNFSSTSAPATTQAATPAATTGHKPFVPSYRLFEDLNVLGNSATNSSSSLSGANSQSMAGGARK